MKVIDLFSGVGGLSLGFEQNGYEVLLANEFDKKISFSYHKNFPKTEILDQDILKLDLKKTFSKFKNKVDLVIGGPPCQGLSQKGQRKWFEDERNYLFKKYIEVVSIIEPEFLLIENVPNIITASNGFFLNQIKILLSQLNYKIDAKILNSKNFGVPQSRRRAFILGRKKKLNFSLEESNGKKTTLSEAIDDLPLIKSGEGQNFYNYDKPAFSDYQKQMRKNSKGVWNHIATKHSKVALERMKYMKINGTRLDLPTIHRTGSIHSGTWSRLDPNNYARTITTRFDTPSSGQFTLPYQDRCLTVREAARIQSFPDNFIFYGNKTTQMHQVGNAVPPILSFYIASLIKKNI